MITITRTTLISEIATGLPSSVRVFQKHGVDFCCGGRQALGVACEELGLSYEEIADELAQSAAVAGDVVDWSGRSLADLMSFIVRTYHVPLRSELPRLVAMASQVWSAHGARTPMLERLVQVIGELSADLREHMQKEEFVLFPAIEHWEHDGWGRGSMSGPIRMMEAEHDRAGAMLAELRCLTSDYVPPAWACATLRALYQGLAELEAEMHVHVHLENNVLFPRVLDSHLLST